MANRYLQHLVTLNRSPLTVGVRRRQLGLFVGWLEERGIHSALKIRPETGLLHFIPRSGLRRFLSRSFENPNFWHQA